MRSSQYKDDDDHSSHHDHVPLATTEEQGAAAAATPPPRWSEKLGTYLKIMATAKQNTTNKDVAAYYKHQRETLKRLIEVNHLQEADDDADEKKQKKADERNALKSAGGASAGTPTSSKEPTAVDIDKKSTRSDVSSK